MRILLTGASGFVGGNLLRQLSAAGHTLIAPARDLSSIPLLPHVEAYRCDLSEKITSLPDDYDAIVHVAAYTHPHPDSASASLQHNLAALQNLIDHSRCNPSAHFIFFSSISIYGRIENPVVDEHTPIINPGTYGITKRLGELLLLEQSHRLRTTILRLPGIIGPHAQPNGTWLARTRENLRQGRPVQLHSPQTPFNNLVHVHDLGLLIQTLLTSATSNLDTLTLSAAAPIPLLSAIQRLAHALDVPLNWTEVPAASPPFIISHQRACEHYGYQPMTVTEALNRFAHD